MAVLSLSSCTEVIDLDLDDQNAVRLVVDASIIHRIDEPDNGYQEIFLSRSRSFFDNVNDDNSISDAIVSVTNNQTGEIFNFSESTVNGMYTTNDFKAKVGNGYTINIEAKLEDELQKFEGFDSIITASPTIDSLYLVREENLFTQEAFYEITIDALNPPQQDYFQFEAFINDSLVQNEFQGNNFFPSLIDDSFFGDSINKFNISDQRIDPEEETPPFELEATMKRISFQTYNYWRKLYVNASSGDDTPQTEVRGSVNNITYPERYAFGTFMTSSQTKKKVTINSYPTE